MLVAAVPLVVAAWAVVRLVSNNERDKADAVLTASAGVAGAEYTKQLLLLDRQAEQVAAEPRVNAAIVRGDEASIRRYLRAHPTTSVTTGDTTLTGSYRGPLATGEAVIERGGREVGAVRVGKPLDEELLTAISTTGAGAADDLLLLTHRGRVVAGSSEDGRIRGSSAEPFDAVLGETDYRAVATRVPQPPGTAVVAARAREDINAAADDAWWSALWAALATLATVGLLAYLVAPAVSGRRWVRRLLPWELEEQYAMEGDGERPFAAPVPSHGTVAAPEPVAAAATVVPAVRHRVVVIDDDPEERGLIADALGPDGVDVATTGDADQGLGLLGATDADLAILDWKMSGRSGAEILAEMNIRHPDVPVLVVADHLEPQQQHVASLLGARDFLVRPIDPDSLLRKAQELLDAGHAERTPT